MEPVREPRQVHRASVTFSVLKSALPTSVGYLSQGSHPIPHSKSPSWTFAPSSSCPPSPEPRSASSSSALFAANAYLTVIESTAASSREIQWENSFYDSIQGLWKPFYLAWLLCLWLGPAYVLGQRPRRLCGRARAPVRGPGGRRVGAVSGESVVVALRTERVDSAAPASVRAARAEARDDTGILRSHAPGVRGWAGWLSSGPSSRRVSGRCCSPACRFWCSRGSSTPGCSAGSRSR